MSSLTVFAGGVGECVHKGGAEAAELISLLLRCAAVASRFTEQIKTEREQCSKCGAAFGYFCGLLRLDCSQNDVEAWMLQCSLNEYAKLLPTVKTCGRIPPSI
jgi:hypothetical protein